MIIWMIEYDPREVWRKFWWGVVALAAVAAISFIMGVVQPEAWL